MKIKKSKGVNESEKRLLEICEKTFLKLWTYGNPYKKNKKEICDCLAVVDNDIFLFSDKNIEFDTKIAPEVAWNRWKKRAINKSMQQLKNAERYIRDNPNEIYIDNKTETELPIKLPDMKDAIFYKIIVANGAEEACTKYHNEGSSLAVSYLNNNNKDINTIYTKEELFYLSLPNNNIFHVLDSRNLRIVLEEPGTISALSEYFRIKEQTIKSKELFFSVAEEETLGMYLTHFDEKKQEHYIVPKEMNKKEFSIVHTGRLEDLRKNSQYIKMKEENKVSYIWDKLIDYIGKHALDGTLLEGNDISDFKQAVAAYNPLTIMAKEPRSNRRKLADKMFKRALEFSFRNNESSPITGWGMISLNPKIIYYFIIIPKCEDQTYEDYIKKRELIFNYCSLDFYKREGEKLGIKRIVGILMDDPRVSPPYHASITFTKV